jgi:hypothetical protein
MLMSFVGYLLLIRKADPWDMFPVLVAVTAAVFVLCLYIHRKLWQMKQLLILKSLAATSSKSLTPERKFALTESGARAFANAILATYFGLLFYVFAQGFMARFPIMANVTVSSIVPLALLALLCWYLGRQSAKSK